ncbi:O-antigen ligase family protein [Mariniflexile litorale]|uniref:O-antigen ligase family protein n=1 Tax=Mariniflexile litorale TaxID=3045158 RepID=A0AAU7EHR2_9FLAO|nr:O-antigen ligase family protein [Mariniflexile sp. KMM 9835]MDQ8211344.1 O-antigen ligase family protein [Mariniflexile sp. KMM 9835]
MKGIILSTIIKNKEKIYVYGLSLFLFLLPFKIRYNNIGLILLIVGWIFNFDRNEFLENFKVKNFKIAYILILIFYFYFVLRGFNFTNQESIFMAEAVKEYGRRTALILFPLLFNYKLINQYYKLLVKIFINGVFLAILICVSNAFYINAIEGIGVGRGLNHFNDWYFSNHLLVKPIEFHPTLFALVCSIVFHLGILQFLNINNVRVFKSNVKAIIISLLVFVFMLALSSRNVIFFTLVSSSFIVLRYVIKQKKFKILFAFFILISSMIILELSINYVNRKRFFDAINLNTEAYNLSYGGTSFRYACGKALYNEIAKEHWLFGIGSGRNIDVFNNAYLKYNLTIAAESNYNAHNQYLETLIYNGILGLLLLLALFIFVFWVCYKQKFYFGAIIVYLLATVSITESILENQKGLWLFITLIFVFSIKSENSFEK